MTNLAVLTAQTAGDFRVKGGAARNLVGSSQAMG
jgi:hypothetical protein